METEIENINKKWQRWHYHNTSMLIASLIIFFLLADTPYVKSTISFIGDFGYVGAFLAGILFVSIFTIAPASVVLFHIAENLNPLGVALAAGVGGMVGDYLIFRYLRDRVFEELRPVFINHGGKPVMKLFKTPYFIWAIPIVGALIIASPLPDEVGIGMLGLAKLKTWKLLTMLFLLDAIGIFIIIVAAKSF